MKNDHTEYAGAAILASDKQRWIELELELPYRVRGSGAVSLNGEIYLFGGIRNSRELYKLGKNLQWEKLADMNIGRKWITNSCLAWNGCIWVLGGKDPDDNRLSSVERYYPKENTWTLMPEMTCPRSGAAAVLWQDVIIISGGYSTDGRTNTAEYFEGGQWTDLSAIPDYVSGHALVSYEDKLILMGGYDEIVHQNVWEADTHESRELWSPLLPMKYAAHNFAGIVLDKEIYALGGSRLNDQEQIEPQSRVEVFDGKQWRDGPTLPYNWSGMSAVLIPKNLAGVLCLYKPE